MTVPEMKLLEAGIPLEASEFLCKLLLLLWLSFGGIGIPHCHHLPMLILQVEYFCSALKKIAYVTSSLSGSQ